MLRVFLPLLLALSAFIGSGEIIHACVANGTGAVRIVSETTTCNHNEKALQWGVVGLQGPKGDPGPPGVGHIGCTNNQVAKWDGTQQTWVCTNDLVLLAQRVEELESLLANTSREGQTITFSNLSIEVENGSLTVGGTTHLASSLDVAGAASFASNLVVDGGTLYVDTVSDNVWINSGTPDGSAAVRIQSGNPNDVTLVLRPVQGQSTRLLRVYNSDGQEVFNIDTQGDLQNAYVSGLTGWRIAPSGVAEFADVFDR